MIFYQIVELFWHHCDFELGSKGKLLIHGSLVVQLLPHQLDLRGWQWWQWMTVMMMKNKVMNGVVLLFRIVMILFKVLLICTTMKNNGLFVRQKVKNWYMNFSMQLKCLNDDIKLALQERKMRWQKDYFSASLWNLKSRKRIFFKMDWTKRDEQIINE